MKTEVPVQCIFQPSESKGSSANKAAEKEAEDF